MCKIVIAHRKPKNALHTRTSQVSTKWVRTRTSQLATAHRNSQLAIEHCKSSFVKYTTTSWITAYATKVLVFVELVFAFPFLAGITNSLQNIGDCNG